MEQRLQDKGAHSNNSEDEELFSEIEYPSVAKKKQPKVASSNSSRSNSKKSSYAYSNAKSSAFESLSSYHQQHSVYKKYLKTPQSQSSTSLSLIDFEPVDNCSHGTTSKNKITQQICKEELYIGQKQQLMKYERMLAVLKHYNPVIFPTDEIVILKRACEGVKEENVNGKEYLDLVYEEYQKLEGSMDKDTVHKKVVCDMLYLIRKENNKNSQFYTNIRRN